MHEKNHTDPGPGCPKCKRLAEESEKAAKELGLDFEIGR